MFKLTGAMPMFKLIDEKSGRAIRIGEHVETFRGERYALESFEPPKHAASTGRVYLAEIETGGYAGSFFPSVIGARIVEIAKDA